MPQLFGWDYLLQLFYALSAYFLVVEMSRMALRICQRVLASFEISLSVLVYENQINK